LSGLLVRDATAVTMDPSLGIVPNARIAVEGRRILAVSGRDEDLPSDWSPDAVIDARGMVALPGLVNAHTHAAMTVFRGLGQGLELDEWLRREMWPRERTMRPSMVYRGALLAAAEMIRGGVTTFADMYVFMGRVGAAVEAAGMRAVLAQGIAGVPRIIGPVSLALAAILHRRWHGRADGRIGVAVGPHAPYTCPPACMRRAARLAKRLGCGIHVHLAETEDEVEECLSRYGLSPVALAHDAGLFDVPALAIHCVHLDDADIDLLAASGTAVAHCPVSNLRLRAGVAPVRRMIEAGVTVALGTDGAGSADRLDMFEAMRTAALLSRLDGSSGLSSRTVLSMATDAGARALGLDSSTGTLTPGKLADVVLLDFNSPHLAPRPPLYDAIVHCARADDVHAVIADGRVIMEAGRLLTVDVESLLEAL